jgi:hypothetical protein
MTEIVRISPEAEAEVLLKAAPQCSHPEVDHDDGYCLFCGKFVRAEILEVTE